MGYKTAISDFWNFENFGNFEIFQFYFILGKIQQISKFKKKTEYMCWKSL